MERFVKGLFAMAGGTLGWYVAAPAGMVVAFFASIVGVALGVYAANRLFLHLLG